MSTTLLRTLALGIALGALALTGCGIDTSGQEDPGPAPTGSAHVVFGHFSQHADTASFVRPAFNGVPEQRYTGALVKGQSTGYMDFPAGGTSYIDVEGSSGSRTEVNLTPNWHYTFITTGQFNRRAILTLDHLGQTDFTRAYVRLFVVGGRCCNYPHNFELNGSKLAVPHDDFVDVDPGPVTAYTFAQSDDGITEVMATDTLVAGEYYTFVVYDIDLEDNTVEDQMSVIHHGPGGP